MRLPIILGTIFLATTGCGSSRPVLHPNDQLRKVGHEVADRDIDDCIERAERSETRINQALPHLEPAPTGLRNASELSEAQKVFVNKCLRDKGYDPVDWD